jgi:iron(III) transport system permease protein
MAIVCVAAVTLLAVIALLLVIGQVAFQDHTFTGVEGYTLRNFSSLYTDPFALNAMTNTAVFGAVAMVVSLALATPIAWLTERTDLPAKRYVFPLMTFTLLVPSFFTAMGWEFLFHPRIGLVNKWLVQILPFDDAPININTLVGMGWVQGLSLTALAFVMVAGSFRAMDPALEESAQIHGLGLLRRLRRITIPLVWPGILAAGIYVLAIGIAAFDVPAIMGMPNRIFTFSTFVFATALPIDGAPDYGLIAASSGVMVLIALGVSWWYLRIISKASRYAVVTGRNYRPRLFELGKWRYLGWGFILLTVFLALVLPMLALIWAAITPVLLSPSREAFDKVSLDNFRQIPWRQFWPAARNSALLLVAVPTFTTIVALAISWVVIRSKIKAAGAFDILAFLPHVVPNLIFAVGALLIALFWLPSFVPLYGTVMLILIVYVVTRVSFATRVFNSALLQIHTELDEAGLIFGLNPLQVFRRILLPLLAPVMAYAWLWMALLTLRELTIAAFLVTRGNVTLPVYVWNIWSNGDLNLSAAASLLLVGIMIPLVAMYFLISQRWLKST